MECLACRKSITTLIVLAFCIAGFAWLTSSLLNSTNQAAFGETTSKEVNIVSMTFMNGFIRDKRVYTLGDGSQLASYNAIPFVATKGFLVESITQGSQFLCEQRVYLRPDDYIGRCVKLKAI